jgi:DNA-binding response OmpR family regulator
MCVANMSRLDHISDARILVVEDQPADLHLLEQVLAASGFRNVGLSSNPVSVASMFDPSRLDLVVLDLWMPGMDGFELLRQLRERIPTDLYFPVLVITADVTVETRRRALLAGATDFVTKPIDVVEVTLRVRQLLEARKLQLELALERSRLEGAVSDRTAELAAANSELADLVRAKDEFFLRLGRELLTPLANVAALTGRLTESIGPQFSEDSGSIVRQIAEESAEATAIVEALLVTAQRDSNGAAGDQVTMRNGAL